MRNTIYLVDIEFIPNRYSCEWKTEFPELLRTSCPEYDVIVIDGRVDVPEAVTPGAFINFGGTNIYKSDQVAKLSELFTLDKINDGDHIIFADAWHPGIINIKYMTSLLGKKVKLHGLWHAGSYDKWDFLGRLIGDADWIRQAEQSFYSALDFNWFATQFHLDMFKATFKNIDVTKSHLSGWPMNYTSEMIAPVNLNEKEDIIIYPHRLAPEKRIDLFKSLALRPELSKYKFVIPMELNLPKSEYHQLLQKAKFIVSFAEQETLGISVFEGLCAGAFPIVPDRLSYSEMYPDWMKIECNSDEEILNATTNKIVGVDRCGQNMKEILSNRINDTKSYISRLFFSADSLVNVMNELHVQ